MRKQIRVVVSYMHRHMLINSTPERTWHLLVLPLCETVHLLIPPALSSERALTNIQFVWLHQSQAHPNRRRCCCVVAFPQDVDTTHIDTQAVHTCAIHKR